tara:strand:+ start:476 stop:700 length:225 start_codon:yes stop_codon:yes gene_type:complete
MALCNLGDALIVLSDPSRATTPPAADNSGNARPRYQSGRDVQSQIREYPTNNYCFTFAGFMFELLQQQRATATG